MTDAVRIIPQSTNLDSGDHTYPSRASSSGGVGTGSIWRGQRVSYVVPILATTTLSGIGESWSSTGTAAAGALAATNVLTSTIRNTYTTSAVVNSQAGLAGLQGPWLGSSAGLGGFRVEIDFAVVTTQTTMRIAVGIGYNGGAAISCTADPSAATDCIFMGCDAADTNMQIMHNDNSGTCTKIDLGASFPKTNNVFYRVVLEAAPNASAITYEVTRFDSAASASGTISTDYPLSSQFLLPTIRFGNGNTASAAAGAFCRYLCEYVTP
jgi:hypothetical protein